MLLRIVLGIGVIVSACQRPEVEALPITTAKRSEVASVVRYDSPQAVYTRYAEALAASQWADAIALFTPAGKAELVISNFKGLAVLPGSPHPKKLEFKAVLQDFCRGHALRCADESWNQAFAPTLLAGASVKAMLSDVISLAKAQPEPTYIELMTLVRGVDQSSVLPLDPTLTDVKYTNSAATGIASRADGQTTTMTFENSPEHGWLIVE
jgi:hypothetical protein